MSAVKREEKNLAHLYIKRSMPNPTRKQQKSILACANRTLLGRVTSSSGVMDIFLEDGSLFVKSLLVLPLRIVLLKSQQASECVGGSFRSSTNLWLIVAGSSYSRLWSAHQIFLSSAWPNVGINPTLTVALSAPFRDTDYKFHYKKQTHGVSP